MFLDTPGHEAFTMMRARGAQVTDIVVLVVSAVDGVMPQTIEAINHAKQAEVPIIVAVNKIDLPEANVELVKKQLTEHGLAPEEWGGTTIYNEVSALKKTGIKELLESILLQAEVLELKASYESRASGIVLESRVDMGRGIVATVILQRGTLKRGGLLRRGDLLGQGARDLQRPGREGDARPRRRFPSRSSASRASPTRATPSRSPIPSRRQDHREQAPGAEEAGGDRRASRRSRWTTSTSRSRKARSRS